MHARTGSNSNTGGSADPVQTVTYALTVVAPTHATPLVVWIAGAYDASGNRIAYDDDPGIPPTPIESFPLPMATGVSLFWWVAGSDPVPGTSAPSRPLIKPLSPNPLITFDVPTYAPAATAITISSLDLENASPGLNLVDSTTGTVRPTLSNLRITGSSGVYAFADAGILSPSIDRSDFKIADQGFGVQFVASGVAAARFKSAQVLSSTFANETGALANTAIRIHAGGDASVETTIEGCLFSSDADAYFGGIRYGVTAGVVREPPLQLNSATVDVKIERSTFGEMTQAGVFTIGGTSCGNAPTTAISSVSISDSTFTGNGHAVPSTAPGAQIWFNIGAGNRFNLLVSGNTITDSVVDGLLVNNALGNGCWVPCNPPTVPYPISGIANIQVSSNDIRRNRDAIKVDAAQLVVTGAVSGNKQFDNREDGLDNSATAAPGGPCFANDSISNLEVTNNFIGGNGSLSPPPAVGSGIVNAANGIPMAGATLSAALTITNNTVAANIVDNLNVVGSSYTMATMVYNSIFQFHNPGGGGSDIVFTPPFFYESNNVFWSNFIGAGVPYINGNDIVDPQLVDIPGRDFQLQLGSLMIDKASETAPLMPRLDHFGNRRPTDYPPIGPTGLTSDKGAHEKQP